MAQVSVTVVLASAGRPSLLSEILQNLGQQTLSFNGIISVPNKESLPSESSFIESWHIITGPRGLTAQRNAGLDAVSRPGLVVFFDDDAVVRPDYLENAATFFENNPHVVGLTGRVLLDGKLSGEIPVAESAEAIRQSQMECSEVTWCRTQELYGANFAIRFDRLPSIRFDERLPLYSWLEDHDFARRLLPYGDLAQVSNCVIVHRAASSGGRVNHRRLGYSQVANPIYLHRKGSFPFLLAAKELLRPVCKNVAFSVVGPQRKWRRERLRSNVGAMRDVLAGRINPEKILAFEGVKQ